MRVNTEFTMFIGADNWFRSDTVEILTNEPADIVTYDIMCTGELLETHPINHERKVWGDTYWCREGGHHGSMMYRTSIGQRVGYSRVSYPLSNRCSIHHRPVMPSFSTPIRVTPNFSFMINRMSF